MKLHDCIHKHNILKEPTGHLGNFFDRNPTIYKIALIINHLFRALAIIGFMFLPGMPQLLGMAICFAGSLFYRLTVEKNCTYKFALPAFAGAAAFMLINKTTNIASLIPLTLYSAYIILTVNHDVNKTHPKPTKKAPTTTPCCCS